MITNQDVLEIYDALCKIDINPAPVKFSYGVSKNKKLLEADYTGLKSLTQPSVEVLEFEKKRIDLCEKYASKNEEGQIQKKIIDENRFEYVFDEEEKSEFEKEIKILEEEYKEHLERFKKNITDFKTILYEDSLIKELYKIELCHVPDAIDQEIMDVLHDVIFVENTE